jgi:GT2 family glycosyltransferase
MLTVLFATYNRSKLLPDVLNAFCGLAHPPGGWKLVIVDNGSTDNTREVIDSFNERLPVTYVFEPLPGKNAALNSGLSYLEGNLVVLTDDDVFPYPDWLVQMRTAADTHPECSVFGGRIIPRWESSPNPWILAWVPLSPVFSISNPVASEGPAGCDKIYGPNMAVRAEVFGADCRFDEQIGPKGSSYPMGSESEFINRLLRSGCLGWYCTGAVVEHFVPRSHLQRTWILGRAVRYGRGMYRLTMMQRGTVGVPLLGIPRHIFRGMLEEQIRILMALLTFNREKCFQARWRFNFLLGEAIEARNIRVEGAVPSIAQNAFRR